jgi:hypothetical protein
MQLFTKYWDQLQRRKQKLPSRVTAIYYDTCAKIDQHNRDWQSTLRLEQKFKTHDWSVCVNTTLFAMNIVDCWKVYSKLTFGVDDNGNLIKDETQKEFYGNLVAEMIDNREDIRITRNCRVNNESPTGNRAIDVRTGLPMSGIGPHLPPTKKRRRVGGVLVHPRFLYQGSCVVCTVGRKKVKSTC